VRRTAKCKGDHRLMSDLNMYKDLIALSMCQLSELPLPIVAPDNQGRVVFLCSKWNNMVILCRMHEILIIYVMSRHVDAVSYVLGMT